MLQLVRLPGGLVGCLLTLLCSPALSELFVPSIISSSGATIRSKGSHPDLPIRGSRPHQVSLTKTFVAEARAKGRRALVVFLGDSITEQMRGTNMGKRRSDRKERVWMRERWYKSALFFGIAHEETHNLLHRVLRNGELARISPRVVVLLIGTNNLGIGKMDAETTARGIMAVVEAVRGQVAGAHIIVQALLPRGVGWPDASRFGAAIKEVNAAVRERVEAMPQSSNVYFLDCNNRFTDPATGRIVKRLMPDNLHPSAEGHRQWADCLRPHLERRLG